MELSRKLLNRILSNKGSISSNDIEGRLKNRFYAIEAMLENERSSNERKKVIIAELEKRIRSYEHEVVKLKKKDDTRKGRRGILAKLRSRLSEQDDENKALRSQLNDLEEKYTTSKETCEQAIAASQRKLKELRRRLWEKERLFNNTKDQADRLKAMIEENLKLKRQNFGMVLKVRSGDDPTDVNANVKVSGYGFPEVITEMISMSKYNEWLRRGNACFDNPIEGAIIGVIPLWKDHRLAINDNENDVLPGPVEK